MKLQSRLPLATMFFRHWHTDDTEVGIIVAKAEFQRREDGKFRANQAPPELVLTDEFDGDDPATAPLNQEQDIAPGKDGTDLVVRAIARSPEAAALSDWPVTVQIPDRLTYGFQVRGPSEWRRGLLGWSLAAPELVHEVPMSYALAYGGRAPGPTEDDPPEFYGFNPSGKGFVTKALLDRKEPIAAPQIGDLAEFIAADIEAEMTVHGLGPIAKAWLPRRGTAGTFDAAWQKTRHPRMPRDYSLRFWNMATNRLQFRPGLRGDELVRVEGISHAPAPVEARLPAVGLVAHLSGDAEEAISMTLDTVDLDLQSAEPTEHRMYLIWRAIVPNAARFSAGQIEGIRIAQEETA